MRRYFTIVSNSMICRLAGAFVLAALHFISTWAAPAEKYAPNSVLSQGYWVKVQISTPGLQTVSRQTLKNYGFNNPQEVYVYGYGGQMTSETLSVDLPDDLPVVPVVRREDGGITFYAAGSTSLSPSSNADIPFEHFINPYSDTPCYFLSDVAPSGEPTEVDLSSPDGVDGSTSYRFMQIHERDLMQYAESGRDYLGEDFKSQKSQTFRFDLPDNVGSTASIRVKFGANTTSQSSIMVNANGTRLPATPSDHIPAVTASDQYYKTTTTTKTVSDAGNSLTVGIEYSQAGVVKAAALDWIEVVYDRALRLSDGQLYFHVNQTDATADYTIAGVSPRTVLWDVTDPWDVKVVRGAYNESAGTITLRLKGQGVKELIALDPSVKGASPTGKTKVSNQNIHGMPTPHMVIITPDTYAYAAERIASLHRKHDGMTVYVLSPEKIYNEFSGGNPDVSAFRKLLKMWYDRSLAEPEAAQFGYCLLMGRPTYDQKMRNPETLKNPYPRTLIWQSTGNLSEPSSYCTDDFIAMLEDEISPRSMNKRKILVGVGRYPVKSTDEANTVADKLEAYMDDPEFGSWRNNVMVIADDGDNAQHLSQAEESIQNMEKFGAGPHYAYEKIYLDAFERKQTGAGLTFPDAKEKMLNKWKREGVSLINYIGHANPKEWGHEKLLTWNDITSLSTQRLPVVYAATCSFGKWDAPSESGAENLLMNPSGGVIAMMTPSRTVYIASNRYITNPVSSQFFKRSDDGRGQRLGDILRLGKNLNTSPDENMLRYHLFGDPALRMPTPQYNIEIESIAGLPVAENQADSPTVTARSSVSISGRVTDELGNTVDFNGPLQVTVFDAEVSILTHGWGDKGKETVYNDRPTKLATVGAMVRDGCWESSVMMPSEISNNFSPALISVYAYDPTLSAEANGSTDRIFVYGYDENAPLDEEGPEIESFGLNSLSSSDDMVVHPNPVALAIFSDESGINISDAGIGQKMTLNLDGKKEYDDISNFFTPDPEDPLKGSIAYPLRDLEPGKHELTLTVWDNANNSSKATLNFKVDTTQRPDVADIKTYYNPDLDVLTIKVDTDRALTSLGCTFECFDLEGNRLWTFQRNVYAGKDSSFTQTWNLTDANGMRLPRGIYMLKTTVTSGDGLSSFDSKKIAVPAK